MMGIPCLLEVRLRAMVSSSVTDPMAAFEGDGSLQSLDWTGGLDRWTTIKDHFYALKTDSPT